ncbi:response regulator transcription factor [Paraburkholderia caballeronis]|uniref:DNA-binding response regulator, OmpR family, contains REC and winged-helix (WHTH) domain n=1 Tax=Paraburkholderia caballeronis TaxID=416943 RepID=A0A1H7RUR3_9BURK|nr:response regulator transcription factor [Paraburkholderia caballeronis]PXW23213.1 winged helix family two component transcriptional regulator [Paraburkholderia caballeronis]PXW97877.1 winged helix family two component transcriptional regulator [Paraburkholderia caballeronis]RAJ94847.1 winged helix family two component transcriptional regulator [Paraburkholderia caballeronis]SEE63731.1 two component transcriptional regulator, winged helix family [Paraburkholderia caballeronis]SEL63749.1 DNA-
MSRVAIVEDHERLADMVRRALAGVGIEADLFRSVSEATYGVSQADYAVLIVDRGLPDGDGLAFLRTLRAAGQTTPCLMLTARDALHDRVDGLESGADDYVTKPFAMSELVARVRTLMRRPMALTALVASFAGLTIDPGTREMRCGARSVLLAPAELQIMLCLFEASGRTVRHGALEHAAWGFGEAVTPNALEVTLHRLRKKLAAIDANARLVNHRGAGFAVEMSASGGEPSQ